MKEGVSEAEAEEEDFFSEALATEVDLAGTVAISRPGIHGRGR
jgi:hypothetical protein